MGKINMYMNNETETMLEQLKVEMGEKWKPSWLLETAVAELFWKKATYNLEVKQHISNAGETTQEEWERWLKALNSFLQDLHPGANVRIVDAPHDAENYVNVQSTGNFDFSTKQIDNIKERVNDEIAGYWSDMDWY